MSKELIMIREFSKLNDELEKKHIALKMKASGDWLKSREIVQRGDSVKINAVKYTYQLVNGRKPGKFPPIDSIKKWIYDKGIVNKIKGDISVSSLAFLIARKIAREGTNYFQQGGPDLVDSVFTPQALQNIIDLVGAELVVTFTSKIENQLKKIVT
jgi:hypothetical protein